MIKILEAVAVAGGLSGCGCDEAALYEAFQDGIRTQLAIPSSAEFQSVGEAVTIIEGECAISVNGWVDASSAVNLVRFKVFGTATSQDSDIIVDAILGPPIAR